MKFDFSGWATKNDLKCADGRTIRRNAFKDDDGHTVPLVWQHQHDNPENVLGHALLENRDNGVYAYCAFNDSPFGAHAKELVRHGDICSLSIYANQLKQNGGDVLHGSIKEVSLVLAGANPGAMIDYPMLSHGEESSTEAYIYTGEDIEMKYEDIRHADEEIEEVEDGEETVQDVFDSMSEKQKNVVYYMIGEAVDQAAGDYEEDDEEYEDTEEEEDMKHNVFDAAPSNEQNTLSHSEMTTILNDAKRMGSLKESVLAHTAEYGIDQIDWLFPDAHNLNTPPEFIKRDMDWVSKVMNAVHHTPFSRIKSMFADITEDDARAKGYIKGKQKKDEVFTLLKRTTDPQTIYKKQKLDRDDVIDITDFDVVAWLKTEMRMMLNEEIARAILVGDGRLSSSDDKISQSHVRSIWLDDDLYTIKTPVAPATGVSQAKQFIVEAIRARKEYKGSGNPTLFTTETMLTEMLLLEDNFGHFLYSNVDALATVMRVKEIVTVPVMENMTATRTDANSKKWTALGVIVNLNDYNVGADKGGAVNMFDDFDIDYNRQKYLIETRCSGALIKPYSAIVLEKEVVASTSSGT